MKQIKAINKKDLLLKNRIIQKEALKEINYAQIRKKKSKYLHAIKMIRRIKFL